MDEQLESVVKRIIVTMYLILQDYGYSEVSLKQNDLLDYVPKLEKLLEKNGLLVSDLFVKTPVSETYDEYKNFLIKELYGGRLGSFNEKYDTIILDCPKFYTYKCYGKLEKYQGIIRDGCYLISGDIGFIDDDFSFELLSIIQLQNKEKTLEKNKIE